MKTHPWTAALGLSLLGAESIACACNRETSGERPGQSGMITHDEPAEVRERVPEQNLTNPPGELPGAQDNKRMLGEPPARPPSAPPDGARVEKRTMRSKADLESAEGARQRAVAR